MKQATLALLLADSVEALSMSAGANPIRRVVTLLQDMQKEVVAEGKKDDELFKKFQCYCKTNIAAQTKAATEAEEEMNKQTAARDEAKGAKETTAAELAQHKQDRKDDTKA